MQAAPQAPEETEADPKDALIAALSRSVSWGYVRAGNAYKFTPEFLIKQDRVVPVDIPPVTAQMWDD